MKLIAYIRVSTQEQVEGFGLEVQRAAIEAHSLAGGHRIAGWYEDAGLSGSKSLEDRDGLAGALAELESTDAEALVVYRLDRLARDLLLQETLIARLAKAGVEVVSVQEPQLTSGFGEPTRDLVRQVLGAISQYERAVIRGRMAAGKAAKAATGGYIGGQPPYGYRAEGAELVLDKTEQTIAQTIDRLRASQRTWREIGDHLTATGVKPRRGTQWHPNVVRRIANRQAVPNQGGHRHA